MSWGYFGSQAPVYSPATNEKQPILRIPVAGPGRFNTLAVMRHRWCVVDIIRPADGVLLNWTLDAMTALVIPDYDPEEDVGDFVRQSTSANLHVYQARAEVGLTSDDGAEFAWAVDRVHDEVHIDEETGRLILHFDLGCQGDQILANAWMEASTWALYYDEDTKPVGAPVLWSTIPHLQRDPVDRVPDLHPWFGRKDQ